MVTKWEDFQEKIKARMREVYSETFVEHVMHPKNMGEIENADSHVSVLGTCGDRITLWLKIEDYRIVKTSFLTDGCSATISCGSMVTELARGKTLDEALDISPEAIIGSFGGFPEDHAHCAKLASLTLEKAIIEYMNLHKKP